MIPIPPNCANTIANFDSVTVSIGEEISGIFTEKFFEIFVERSISDREKSEYPGKRRISSKVKPRGKAFVIVCSILYFTMENDLCQVLSNVKNVYLNPSDSFSTLSKTF